MAQPLPVPSGSRPDLTLNTDEITGEDGLYNDDALIVMQPALSAVATRLTLPKTPAAEKAAAMERVPSNPFFESAVPNVEGDISDGPQSPAEAEPIKAAPQPLNATSSDTAISTGQSPPAVQPLPTPWRSRVDAPIQARPQSQQQPQQQPQQPKRALESVSLGQTRQKRSGSTGTEALKRLSRALPSLPNASNFFNSVFSSSPNERPEPSPGFPRSWTSSSTDQTLTPLKSPRRTRGSPTEQPEVVKPSPVPHRPSVYGERVLTPRSSLSGAAKPVSLRRVASDDSLLYHSLSRVSSLGDDSRFENVREMTNVRMKAIKDSLPERPSFKMPSMPSMPRFSIFQDSVEQNSKTPPIPEDPAVVAEGDGSTPLDRVLETLTGDLVVLGGYRGSVLRSAEAPHQQLWAPVKIGFNLRKADLEVGLDYEDELTMEERIIPSGMLQNIGPIDISRKFFKKLRSCENARNGKLRIWDYGYDWRLSPHLLSQKMIAFLEKLPSNRVGYKGPKGALVIAHSLGGIITRHVVNQRPDLFSGVVYAGVPQRCINVLGPIRNGDAVLLNEKILTAQVNFSLRTTFAFLPEDGFCFIDKDTNEPYPIDFYDANEWVKTRLSPCVGSTLPALNPKPATGLGAMLRNRSNSLKRMSQTNLPSFGDASRASDLIKEMNLNPQLDSNRSGSPPRGPSPFSAGSPSSEPPPPPNSAKSIAYLKRILPEIKRFRSELAHRPEHSDANVYPPIAMMYGKNTPTVYAARVAGRQGIPCADAYDDLVFRSGDGVVLAREAQVPEGYELVNGGRICTERGHLTMLGDMPAIGKALEAVVKGRKKGIGMGKSAAVGAEA